MAAARKKFAITPWRQGPRNPRSAADRGAPPEHAVDNTEAPQVNAYPVNRKKAKVDAREWDERAAAMRAQVLNRRGRP